MIVEDEGLFRDMLRVALAERDGLEVVGAVGDGVSAIRMARELKPEVIIMDIELGGGPNGIEAGMAIREEDPDVGSSSSRSIATRSTCRWSRPRTPGAGRIS